MQNWRRDLEMSSRHIAQACQRLSPSRAARFSPIFGRCRRSSDTRSLPKRQESRSTPSRRRIPHGTALSWGCRKTQPRRQSIQGCSRCCQESRREPAQETCRKVLRSRPPGFTAALPAIRTSNQEAIPVAPTYALKEDRRSSHQRITSLRVTPDSPWNSHCKRKLIDRFPVERARSGGRNYLSLSLAAFPL